MCIFFASPFEFNIQITIIILYIITYYILRKVDFERYNSIDLHSFCTRPLVPTYGTRKFPESRSSLPYQTFSDGSRISVSNSQSDCFFVSCNVATVDHGKHF